MNAPVIAARHLSKRFGDVLAVDDISFSVARRSVCALLGGNGAGKTTTLSMLLGLLAPSSGQISVLGEDIQRHRYRILGRVNYAVTYSPGKILQPTGIRSQDESQQTDLRAIHSGGLLWFTLFGEVTIKPYYNSNRYHGKSFWYSFGTRFADFNKILLTDKLTSIELCWRNLGYTFSREKIRYELYGQVRGFPFTSAAIDLLGSEFVISSQGAADITSHQLSLRLGRETQSFLRLTTAYQQVDLLKFDYRTYALILGFPRRETLRISRSKLQRATLFKLSLHGSIPLTSHLSCVPALLQYIPIHVEYTSTSQPGGGPAPSGKRHTFGGLRISVQFYYTI
ncbi:MAG: ATP-binding cassette domain-containing protein [Calditrichota bacterium]